MPRPTLTLTASLLTPPGRGAVAVVRLHDSSRLEPGQGLVAHAIDSCFAAVNGRPLSRQTTGKLCYGHWVTDLAREDVVVCRIDESTVEVSCHGGRAAVTRILNSLKLAGVSIEDWQSQQAAITSPFDAELADALSQATTIRTAAMLADQASGTLRNGLAALLALGPDELASRLDELLTFARFGLRLTQPWRVVLSGRPNVGKSTLINALLGYTRSIVFDQPGTTRDVVTAHTAFDGWPFQLADTAGIRCTTDELEQVGIDRARRAVDSADLICLLLDTSQPATQEDQDLVSEFNHSTTSSLGPVIVVAHKADLPDQWGHPLPEHALQISSITGDGVKDLMTRFVQALIPHVPAAGVPIPVSQRQVQWLQKAREELAAGVIPQSVAAIKHCLTGTPFECETLHPTPADVT